MLFVISVQMDQLMMLTNENGKAVCVCVYMSVFTLFLHFDLSMKFVPKHHVYNKSGFLVLLLEPMITWLPGVYIHHVASVN